MHFEGNGSQDLLMVSCGSSEDFFSLGIVVLISYLVKPYTNISFLQLIASFMRAEPSWFLLLGIFCLAHCLLFIQYIHGAKSMGQLAQFLTCPQHCSRWSCGCLRTSPTLLQTPCGSPQLMMASGADARGERLTFSWGGSHQEFNYAPMSVQTT